MFAFFCFALSEVNGQLADYVLKLKTVEYEQLEEGLLLVPLDSTTNQYQDFIDSTLTFTRVVYFNPEGQRDSLGLYPLEVYSKGGSLVPFSERGGEVFYLEVYTDAFDLPIEWHLQSARKEPSLSPDASEGDTMNAYQQELALFSPENTNNGGLLLVKAEPLVRPIGRRKLLVADFYYFGQFHTGLPEKVKMERAISRLNELHKERGEALGY